MADRLGFSGERFYTRDVIMFPLSFPNFLFLFQPFFSTPKSVRNDGENYPPFDPLAVFGGFFCLNRISGSVYYI
jgi:hypothetical protein